MKLDDIDCEEMIYKNREKEMAKQFLFEWFTNELENHSNPDTLLINLVSQAIEWGFEQGVISQR